MKSKHGLPSRESLHGCRGDQDNDNINGECGKNWKITTLWDGDETYSMKKSPSLDDRRQKNCHRSLKDDWSRSQRSRIRRSGSCSRSRSRSPVRSVRRQSDFHEGNRKRSGVSTQVCKDFMAGRCKRGDQCHFLHQDIQSHEDGWDNKQTSIDVSKNNTRNDDKDYLIKSGISTDRCTDYLKGNCRKGASCRFAHDGVSDGSNRGLLNEISRERETNKRNRVITPERDIKGKARQSSDTHCKYFVAGDCRKGNYCRFSHHGQAHRSPECDGGVWGLTYVSLDKFLDGAKLKDVDASFNVEKSSKESDAGVPNETEKPLISPKWSDVGVSNETEKPLISPKWSDADASVDVDNSCSGSKWSDTVSYSRDTKLKDTNEKMGASKPRFSNRSVDERWQHDYDVCGKNSESNVHYKRVDIDKEEGISKKIENDGANIGFSEPKHAEESIGDMEMSPEWNYKIHSSINKEKLYSSEPTHMAPLPAHEKNITEKDSSQACDELSASQRMSTDESNFQLDHMTRGNSVAALPCDSNVVRNSSISQIDLKFSTNILPMPCFEHSGPSSSSSPHSNANTIGQSELLIPSNEVNLKISLNNPMFQEEKPSGKLNIGDTSILHGNYGSPSSQNMVTSFANSEGPIEAVSVPTIQPCQKTTFPKQYDSRSDGIEPAKRKDTNTKPSNFLVNPVCQVNTADGKRKVSANKLLPSYLVGGTYGSDYQNDHSSKHESDSYRHKPNNLEPIASSEVKENGVVKTKKADVENKNGLSENIDAYDRTEEGRKNKDGKEIRAFKFALVEFVKDLLKPTWKEGQIGKEAYKSIVKKVVDKVTATMQVTNIPQTPEKIDQYLSFSKPKLSKLVQAYVENLQKS